MTINSAIQHTDNDTTTTLATTLALLWLVVMLNMVYADILAFVSAFITPGVIDQLMNGYSGSVKLSQPLLLVSAVWLEIPIMMILISKITPLKMNRSLNMVASIVTLIFVIGGIEREPFYLFLVGVQIVTLVAIFWLSLRANARS